MDTQSLLEQGACLGMLESQESSKKKKWGNRWNISTEEVLFYQNVRKTIEIKLRKVIKKGTDEAEFQSERQAIEGRSSVDNSPSCSPILSTKEALYSSISSPQILCFHSQECYPILNLFFHIYLYISKTLIKYHCPMRPSMVTYFSKSPE